MPKVSWSTLTPTDASSANSADDQIRSDITALATMLGESFYWPASGAIQGASTASTGELRPGTARPAAGAVRLGGSPDGTLSYDIVNGMLCHTGSAAHLVGGTAMAEHADTTGIGGARWVVCSGAERVTLAHSDGEETQWNFGVQYDVAPMVFASLSTTNILFTINSTDDVKAISYYSKLDTNAGSSVQTFYWISLGTVTY